MADFPSCPFCSATSVKLVLAAVGSLSDLDSFVCTVCNNRWCAPKAVARR